MNEELDEVLFWIGGDPIPRVEACAADPAWQFAGRWFGSSDWVIRFCTDALCRRRWDEGLSMQHSCNPDEPG